MSSKRTEPSKSAPRRRATRIVSQPEASAGLDLATDKLYFKIGEVSEIVGVQPYVLRYWETEFKTIRPQKTRSQQRVYRRRDVETLLRIKHLLYDQKFTIAGARKQLRDAPNECDLAPPDSTYVAKQSLLRVRSQLEAVIAFVDSDGAIDPLVADPAGHMQARAGQGSNGIPSHAEGSSLISRPERDPR